MADLVKVIDVRANVADAQQKMGKLQLSVKKLQEAKRRLNKALKEGKISQNQYTTAISANHTATKKAQMGVRQYSKSIMVANGAMKKTSGFVMGIRNALTGLAAQFLGVMAAFMLVRNVVGIFKDFEQANADLAAVLGKTRGEISDLTEDAKRLGSVTAFTASEVSQLQKEFAKLGFSTDEILNATEATLNLAAATGTDLPRAAEVAGSTVRAFGLDAKDTQRVTDVMAKSFSSSALDMEKFATAMRGVAPVAKNAGLNIEQTTAMLGVLVDRGIDASTAGTSLRNVFLELSKQGLTFEEAMQQINSSTDKNATALELFGKRGAVTGTILAETADDAAKLEEKLNDAGGAAEQMAKTQLNTLEGAMTLLNSAWEGFILSLEDGNGQFATTLTNIVKVTTEVLTLAAGTETAREELDEAGKSIRDTAENVMTLLKAIKLVVTAWVTYRATMIATRAATVAYTTVTTALRVAKVMLAKGIGSATKSMKLFNAASKANVLGAIAAVVVTLVTSMRSLASETREATREQKRWIEVKKQAQELEANIQKSEESFEARKLLSKQGLKNLKESLQQEIDAIQKSRDEALIIGKKNSDELIKLVNERNATTDKMARIAIGNEIQDEQDRINKLIELETGYTDAKWKKRAELRTKLKEINRLIRDEEKQEVDDANKETDNDREKAEQKRLEQQQKYQQLRLELATQEASEKTKEIAKEISEIQKVSEAKVKAIISEMESKAELRMLEAETLEEERLAAIDIENANFQEQLNNQKLRDNATEEEKKAHNTRIELLQAQHTKKLANIENTFEKLKQENRNKDLQATANFVGALGGLAEQGSNTQKALMSAQALISTYLSAQKAYESQFVPLATVDSPVRGVIAAATATISGLARVAKINGVKFAQGGVLRGKSHARGGIPTIDGQYEFEGGEAVINKRSTAKYGALLSQINQAGGGVAFEKGGITKFQDGGVTAPISFPDAGTDVAGVTEQLTAQMGAIKVVNVVSETTEQQNSILNVESEAQFG